MTVTERLFGGKSAAAEDAPPFPQITNPKAHPLAKEAKAELRRAEVHVQDTRDRRRDLRDQKQQLERTADRTEGDELTDALNQLDAVEGEMQEIRQALSDAATARQEAADRHAAALETAAEEISAEANAWLAWFQQQLANVSAEQAALCAQGMTLMKEIRDRNLTARAHPEIETAVPMRFEAIYKAAFLGDRGALASLRQQLRANGFEAKQ